MGIDASTDAAAERALRALRVEERRQLIAPVCVVELADETATRHIAARLASPPNADTSWRLEFTLESGETRTVEGKWPRGRRAELAIPWPDYPALGYHRLRLTIEGKRRAHVVEQTLIVVPSRCVTPCDLLGDARAFGLVASLYSVRSERNWGVGDLTDLDALVRWMGEVGGAFVGVNPLHALANRGPDISPYSPVSRIFRNSIYLDIDAIPELHDAPNVAARLDHPELIAELEALREDPYVRYEQVMALKLPVLEELHAVFQRKKSGERAAAYDAFVRREDPELTRFATFLAIAESCNSWSWRDWPPALQDAFNAKMRIASICIAGSNSSSIGSWASSPNPRAEADCRSACIRISPSARHRPGPTAGPCPASSCAAPVSARPLIPMRPTGKIGGCRRSTHARCDATAIATSSGSSGAAFVTRARSGSIT